MFSIYLMQPHYKLRDRLGSIPFRDGVYLFAIASKIIRGLPSALLNWVFP